MYPSRRQAILAFTLLLVSTLAPPTGTAQEPGVVHKEDPKGDVTLSAQNVNSPGLPDSDITSYLDISQLTITDVDEETLRVRVKVGVPFQLFSGQSFELYGVEETFHQLHFSVPGAGGQPVPAMVNVRSVHVRVENATPVAAGFRVVYAALCFPGALQSYQLPCEYAGEPVGASLDQGALVVIIPKIKLTLAGQDGQRTRPANLPPRLVAGDALTDVYYRTVYRPFYSGGGLGLANLNDRAPDTGVLQVPLRYASPAPDLRMSVSQYAVIGGQENQVPVLVQNLGTHKRIVNLSIEPAGTSATAPWPASITPSVVLGAGKSSNVTLRVTAPPGAEDGAWNAFKLRATILTEPGTIAIANLLLLAQPPLDRDHSTFVVHGRQSRFFNAGATLPILEFGFGGLTRSEKDPRLATSTPFPLNSRFSAGGLSSFSFDAILFSDAIPNPATFVPGEPMRGTVEIDAPYPGAATLTVSSAFGPQLVLQHQKPVTLVAGRNKFDVEAPLIPNMKRLDPSNGTLRVDVKLSVQGADAIPYFTSYWTVNVPKLIPKSTVFRFPLEREYPAVEDVSALKVFLSPAEELEAFVNPGRVSVFELDVRNEEPKTVAVDIEALNVTEPWTASVEPRGRLRLGSQDSVHLGVLVRAPESAKEGDALKFRVVVRDVVNGTLVSGQWIRTIVTRGIDIENETFEVAQEDAKKIEAQASKTPGLGLPVVALVALVVARAFRRRRGAPF